MTFESLLASPAIQALGWSLLHFLWQGVLVAVALYMVNALAGRSLGREPAAKVRYAAASIAMLSMPLLLILTTIIQSYPVPVATLSAPAATLGATQTPPSRAALVPAVMPAVGGTGLPGWVVCIWLAGVLAMSGRATGGWMRAWRLKHRGTHPVNPEWIEALDRLKERLQVTRSVRLCASGIAKVPTVIGWMRPLILLPATAITGLTEAQLRAVLAHELAHVRRHDYLINLVQTAVETLLFYHPAVWWIGHQMRIEREHCCDDLAVEVCGDAAGYAGALAQLEELRGRITEPALAANGGNLLGRIRRLLDHEQSENRIPKSVGALAAAVLILGAIAMPVMQSLSAAPQEPPKREEKPIERAPGAEVQLLEPSARTPQTGRSENSLNNGIGNEIRNAENEIRELNRLYREGLFEYRRAVSEFQANVEIQNVENKGPSSESIELLIKLFDSSKDPEIQRHIMDYLAQSNDPRAAERLLSAARSATDLDLRIHAIDYLASRANSFDALVALYDESREVDVKRHVLDYIAASKDPRVMQKLFSIAQSDPNIELRRHAVDYIASR